MLLEKVYVLFAACYSQVRIAGAEIKRGMMKMKKLQGTILFPSKATMCTSL